MYNVSNVVLPSRQAQILTCFPDRIECGKDSWSELGPKRPCDLHAFLLKETHKSVPIEGLVLSARNPQGPLSKYVPAP